MCWNFLKSIYLLWLLAALFACVYGRQLQAQGTSPTPNYTSLEPPKLVSSLLKNNAEERIIASFYKNKSLTLEKQLADSAQTVTDLQSSLTKITEYSQSYKENSELEIKEKDKEISHLNLVKYEWAGGGFVIGVSVVALLMALK